MDRNGNNGRPKLELKLNESVQVILLKDKPFRGSSPYGLYALFTVEHEGTEKVFFAPEDLAMEIEQLGAKTGDRFLIRKVAVQNGRKVTAKYKVERIETPQAPEETKVVTVPGAKADGLREIMEQSLREAVDITRSVPGVPFQNEDIQKIASCLFIART
jgi:hypothetical protein